MGHRLQPGVWDGQMKQGAAMFVEAGKNSARRPKEEDMVMVVDTDKDRVEMKM